MSKMIMRKRYKTVLLFFSYRPIFDSPLGCFYFFYYNTINANMAYGKEERESDRQLNNGRCLQSYAKFEGEKEVRDNAREVKIINDCAYVYIHR